jgi:hypothetical protein
MKKLATVMAGLLLAISLAACGGDDDSGSGGTVDNEPIQITFKNGDVTPKGERVKVLPGTVTFDVTADEPGTIHVHSSPEQEIDYESGTHSYDFAIDKPGVVEVESHDLDVVILQLAVE